MSPLQRLLSDYIGRSHSDNSVSDYSIKWKFTPSGLYQLNVDIVTLFNEEKKSVLIQISAVGNSTLTERIIKQIYEPKNQLIGETVMLIIESPEIKNLQFQLGREKVFQSLFEVTDSNTGFELYFKIRSVLMGEDDGDDIQGKSI